MATMHPHAYNIRTLAALCWLALAGCPAFSVEPILSVRLNGDTSSNGAAARIEVAPGSSYVRSADDRGLTPGSGTPLLAITPDGSFWKDRGTLAFRFLVSREIRGTSLPGLKRKGNTILNVVDCPVARIDIAEQKKGSQFLVRIPGDPRTGKRPGRVNVTFLKPGIWYHFALSWDSGKKSVTAFLNGADVGDLFHWNNAPMTIAPQPTGAMRLGGRFGKGEDAVDVAIDEVRIYGDVLGESDWKRILTGRHVPAVDGETRTVRQSQLDISPYRKTLVYEADFSKPIKVVHEEDLFRDGMRVKSPANAEWVLEGPGRTETKDGVLALESLKPTEKGHVVLWNTRAFPADFLVEYDFAPSRELGLHIVFFAARSTRTGSIFDLHMPKREGVFKNYIAGPINSYHVSLFAADDTKPRRSANLRKNSGFYLVGAGTDNIAGHGPGPHKVRVLKVGGKIRVETAGKMALAFDDNGETYGPVWGEGLIGLRIMGHTHKAAFSNLKVYALEMRR